VKTTAEIAGQLKIFKAKKQYKDILEIANSMPNNKEKYLLKCNALLHLKKWQELSDTCDKAISLDDISDFYNLKGKAVGKLGNFN
jgi:hypothetical protein